MRGRVLPLFLLLVGSVLAKPAAAQQGAETTVSCIGCHAAMAGRLADPVTQWRGSIHAANGIACNSCHGGDPTLDSMEAMSPERGFVGVPKPELIPEFCGKCHAGVLEDYLQSAHGEALGSGGPTCVTCHGNHAVQTATPELINRETCTQCHGYERAEEIKGALAQTDAMISSLEQDISRLHRIGFDTKDLQQGLFAVRNQFHRLFHSVDLQRIVRLTEGFQGQLQGIQKQVQEHFDHLQWRRIVGGVIVGLLALTTFLSYLLRRTYKNDEGKQATD